MLLMLTRRIKNFWHLIQAIGANIYYGFPSRKIKVIGVTGTDGKTTTSHLIYHILKNNNKKVSLISTVYAVVGNKKYPTGLHVTTPSSFKVQKLLRQAVDNGDEYFVLETTAHGINQNRVWGVRYDISVLTNVTPEHLKSKGGYDYFSNLDYYTRVKLRLLKSSKKALVNCDDGSYKLARRLLRNNLIGYSLEREGCKYKLDLSKKLKTELPRFNKYNYLAAFSVAKELGLSEDKILASLKTFKLPAGRLELVYDNKFKVYIDFAHTINGLLNVLSYLREKKEGRLIHVFGSAGLRDRLKREKMGEVSARFCDLAIITEEDYRTENPVKIADEIAVGFKKRGFRFVNEEKFGNTPKRYTYILRRNLAINKAICVVRKGDIVVITGKSHEKSLARGRKEYPWDEKKAVEEAISIC